MNIRECNNFVLFININMLSILAMDCDAKTLSFLNEACVLYRCSGDNMMTALSVARECNLVGTGERVILVSVSPPDSESGTSTINWTELESQANLPNKKSVANFSTFEVR